MIRAAVLAAPPVSGLVKEVRFDASGDCTWVRFTDNETGAQWCGVFGNGDSRGAKTVAINTDGQAFVIAGGQGYLINTASRQLLHKTNHDYLQAAIAVPGKEVYIAGDFTKLYAYSSTGLVWHSPRVSVDGLSFTGATESQVDGLVESLDGKVPFTLRLAGWEYQSEFVVPQRKKNKNDG